MKSDFKSQTTKMDFYKYSTASEEFIFMSSENFRAVFVRILNF